MNWKKRIEKIEEDGFNVFNLPENYRKSLMIGIEEEIEKAEERAILNYFKESEKENKKFLLKKLSFTKVKDW